MENKKKLSLEDISVESFVTKLSSEDKNTVDGAFFTPFSRALLELLTFPHELGDSECSAGHHWESC